MAKSMVPPAPQSQGLYKTFGFSEYNQPARSASQTIRAPCSAAQRSAAYRNQLAAHRSARSALYRTPCSAAHYIASRAAQRTARMQPARRACICACNGNQLAAPASAPARRTSLALNLPHFIISTRILMAFQDSS
jgi:hypothetical protein